MKPWALLVELYTDTRLLTMRALEREGFAVCPAATQAEVDRLLDEHRFDLLVCDVGHPAVDEHALLRKAQEHPLQGGLATIALCDYPAQEHCARARAAGYDEVLTKPLQLDAMRSAIQGALAKRAARSESAQASQPLVVDTSSSPLAAFQSPTFPDERAGAKPPSEAEPAPDGPPPD